MANFACTFARRVRTLGRITPFILGTLLTILGQAAFAQDRVPWQTDIRQAMHVAAGRSQLVLLHFYGDNCPPCLWMEHHVFNRPEVIRALTLGFVPVKINCDQRADIADRYRVESMPTDVILTADGREVHRSGGAQAANKYIAYLDQIVANYRVGQAPMVAGAQPSAAPATNGYQPPPYANQPQGNAPYQASSGNTEPVNPNAARKTAADMSNANPNTFQPVSAPVTPSGSTQASFTGNRYANPYVTNEPAADQYQGSIAENSFAENASAESEANQVPASDAGFPSSSPPLVMGGFCPVSLVNDNAWEHGDARFGAIHRGRTFLFANAAQREKFLATPEKYAPALAGYDAVRFMETGQLVEGLPDFGLMCEDRIYLFADRESQERFAAAARTYTQRVRDVEKLNDPMVQ